MGRLTEYIDFLNRDTLLSKHDERFYYSNITLQNNDLKLRRQYQKSVMFKKQNKPEIILELFDSM